MPCFWALFGFSHTIAFCSFSKNALFCAIFVLIFVFRTFFNKSNRVKDGVIVYEKGNETCRVVPAGCLGEVILYVRCALSRERARQRPFVYAPSPRRRHLFRCQYNQKRCRIGSRPNDRFSIAAGAPHPYRIAAGICRNHLPCLEKRPNFGSFSPPHIVLADVVIVLQGYSVGHLLDRR